MLSVAELKKMWKKLRINGQIKNYSSKVLWILETDSGRPGAHKLGGMMKTPPAVDIDAFKRCDGIAIEGHSDWWKFYDFSTVDVYDNGADLMIGVIKKLAVTDTEFGANEKNPIHYDDADWGKSIKIITDVRRDERTKQVTAYLVTEIGWLDPMTALEMTCRGEIDNGRPVFPTKGSPNIRPRRDSEYINNISSKGSV